MLGGLSSKFSSWHCQREGQSIFKHLYILKKKLFTPSGTHSTCLTRGAYSLGPHLPLGSGRLRLSGTCTQQISSTEALATHLEMAFTLSLATLTEGASQTGSEVHQKYVWYVEVGAVGTGRDLLLSRPELQFRVHLVPGRDTAHCPSPSLLTATSKALLNSVS